jgi:hypothetical protein
MLCWPPASTPLASTRIEDLASGRHDARPGLAACLKAIQPGNTLVLASGIKMRSNSANAPNM